MPAFLAHEKLLRVLTLLARPLAAFCLKHGLGIREVTECLKVAFTERAQQTLSEMGEETNLSRISLVTGIHRLETGRILKEGIKAPEHSLRNLVGQWQFDKRFSSEPGTPLPLPYEGKKSIFASLVRSISKDLNHYTVLLELERTGMVIKKEGSAYLQQNIFQPVGDIQRGFEILARDSELLHQSAQENILSTTGPKHLHLCTQYDNIPASKIAELRQWIFKLGSDFHTQVRHHVAQFDRDLHPDLEPQEARSTFSFVTFGYTKDIDQ